MLLTAVWLPFGLGLTAASATTVGGFEIDGNYAPSTDTDWTSAGVPAPTADGLGASDSTVFQTSSKESNNPSTWSIGNGAPSTNNDIENVYVDTGNDGTTSYVWFGWDRINPQGTDFYYIELNKNPDSDPGIPDRSPGDSRFTIHDQGNNTFTLDAVDTWTGTA